MQQGGLKFVYRLFLPPHKASLKTCPLEDLWAFQHHPSIGTLKTNHRGYLRPSQVEGIIGTTSQLSCTEFMS